MSEIGADVEIWRYMGALRCENPHELATLDRMIRRPVNVQLKTKQPLD